MGVAVIAVVIEGSEMSEGHLGVEISRLLWGTLDEAGIMSYFSVYLIIFKSLKLSPTRRWIAFGVVQSQCECVFMWYFIIFKEI